MQASFSELWGSPAYLARPQVVGPWSGVVVIHEIFGLNDDIRALSDRLAGIGYLALAPDFYNGDPWYRCMKAAFASWRPDAMRSRRHGKRSRDSRAARAGSG